MAYNGLQLIAIFKAIEVHVTNADFNFLFMKWTMYLMKYYPNSYPYKLTIPMLFSVPLPLLH